MPSLIEESIENKMIISRDDTRGRFIDNMLVLDACYLLDRDVPEGITEYSEPDEHGNVYDIADELEHELFDSGFSVIRDGGYIIYKKLTQKEKDWLNDNG